MMSLQCSACRKIKDEDLFHKNRATKSGRDTYCIECRSQYRLTGRTWLDRTGRKQALADKGLRRCGSCKNELPLSEFYDKNSKCTKDQHSAYCRECSRSYASNRYRTPAAQQWHRAYHKRIDVIERVTAQRKASPRHSLSIRLNAALKRRPTENAVSLDDLMGIWTAQGGLCAVSGLRMTWRGGNTQPTSVSIDRIDSLKGYTKDNVRLVCCMVNIFKGRWSDAEMLAMARAIVDNMSPKREPSLLPQFLLSEAA